MPKCPICLLPQTNTWNDYMDHFLMESLWECNNCEQYASYYATGNHEENIGKYIFYDGWHGYNPPGEEEWILHDALVQIAIENTRRELGIPFIYGAIAVSQL